MRKLSSIFLIACFCLGLVAVAKEVKRPDSYAYNRGVEALENENLQEAVQWFSKELAEHPDNGYAYFYLASISGYTNDFSTALGNAEKALNKIPKKDKRYRSITENLKATIYLAMEDTVKGLDSYEKALKIDPTNTAIYEDRADLYYEMGKYDLADADYLSILKVDPNSSMANVGLGRNAKSQENWDEAINYFTKAVKLSPDYSRAYAFRAEAYMGKKQWSEAADDIIKALAIDGDSKAYNLLNIMEEEGVPLLKTKMKIEMTKNPGDISWPYFIASLEYQNGNFNEAIEYFSKANEIDADPIFLRSIARCYDAMGDYETALDYIDRSLNSDPDDFNAINLKARLLSSLDRYDESIAEKTKLISRYPDEAMFYVDRAEDYMFKHQFNKAADDYYTAEVIMPWLNESSYLLMKRGDAYRLSDQSAKAQKDYNRILELEKDSTLTADYFTPFAYSGLGDAAKALETMKQIVDNDTVAENAGTNLYNLACIYARIGQKENAVKALRQAIEKEGEQAYHIEYDYDFIPLYDMPEFKKIVEERKKKSAASKASSSSDKEYVYETVEVPFTKKNGVTEVKCTINGLPLYFVFDTGAADVTLSMVEANFMLKNDYIKKEDFRGYQYYVDANGDISEGSVINLKNVNFGGLELENVSASVVRNQKAPLLLGQSVLGRLGKIEIDNSKMKLKITHKVEKK